MNATTDGARRLIMEEIPVASNELLARVKALLAEGTVRHIKVKSATGEVYFEVPLAIGVLGGAALAWASPWLAMVGALAGLVTSVKLEVAREPTGDDAIEHDRKAAADQAWKAVTARREASRAGGRAKTATKRSAAPAKKTTAKAARAAPAKKPRAAAGKTGRGRAAKPAGRR